MMAEGGRARRDWHGRLQAVQRWPGHSPWRWLLVLLAGWCGLWLLLIVPLRWIPPLTTSFMLQSDVRPVQYHWVPMTRIAPAAALAVVASEDQKFPFHHGFDFEAMEAARAHNERGGHIRGASTISQQTAKNLFLWSGRSYFRKLLEAGVTVGLEMAWNKQRILEVYLNVAQFGPGVYGVEAAAERFYGKPASRLSEHEAALLAAVLPDPDRYSAGHPSAWLQDRAEDIEQQMHQLGAGYLHGLD